MSAIGRVPDELVGKIVTVMDDEGKGIAVIEFGDEKHCRVQILNRMVHARLLAEVCGKILPEDYEP